MKRRILPLLALLAFPSAASAATAAAGCKSTTPIDLAPLAAEIAGRKIAFVAKDPATGECSVANPAAIGVRHAPWSTFKIPHFLIALETGAVQSADETLPWDPKKRPAQSYWSKDWARDQTMRTAFERSAAWYFQELVARVGRENYRKWVGRFGYGNQEVPAGNDGFWLGGPLLISPAEQVAFLSCLVTTGCGVSPKSLQELEKAAFQEEKGGLRLYAKTGSGPVRRGEMNGDFQGWYVGFVRGEDGKPSTVFAFYAEGGNFSSIRSFRREMATRLLSRIGRWPG